MSEKNDGGHAFPTDHALGDHHYGGMTLRDYFAAKAMHARMLSNTITMLKLTELGASNEQLEKGAINGIERARISYEDADAMLKAREE